MVNPVSYALPYQPFIERVKIQAEIAALRESIKKWSIADDWTGNFQTWLGKFASSLKEVAAPWKKTYTYQDEKAAATAFIPLLQQLMVDPRGVVLDDNALLGNDGHVYNSQSYAFWYLQASKEARRHSPLDPTSARFTVRAHDVVYAAVSWLKRRNAYVADAALEQAFQTLQQAGKVPIFPTERNAQAQELEEEDEVEATLNAAIDEGAKACDEEFAKVDQEREAHAKKMQEELEQERKRTEEIGKAFDAFMKKLKEEILEVRELNRSLQAELDAIEKELDVVHANTQQLEKSLQELKAAIEARAAQKTESLINTIGLTVACVVASYFLPPGAPTPYAMPGGGIGGRVAVPLPPV